MKRFLLASLLVASVFAVPFVAQAGEVYNREANQQARIAQGIANGTLGPGELASLEFREYRLNSIRQEDLNRNGGYLTQREYRHLNTMENRDSAAIYHDKHDGYNW